MANYLDETGLQTLRTRIEAVYRRRDDMIGTVMWWSGSISSIPSNAKICNGQSLSSTTYATLYARIGTTYGGDSTNFALPDLRTSSDYGRFVRARFKDIGSGEGQITLANITQADAIRNISGTFYGVNNGGVSGAFSNGGYSNIIRGGNGIGAMYYTFSANNGGGKGTATDSNGGIRPYNISMIPIIIVS